MAKAEATWWKHSFELVTATSHDSEKEFVITMGKFLHSVRKEQLLFFKKEKKKKKISSWIAPFFGADHHSMLEKKHVPYL